MNAKQVVPYIIGLNLAVFGLGYIGIVDLNKYFALHFPLNADFRIWQVITQTFLHGSELHLAFNLFALFSFAPLIEKHFGSIKFLLIYFLCALGASLLYSLVNYFEYMAVVSQIQSLGYGQSDIDQILQTGTVNNQILKAVGEANLQNFYLTFYGVAVGASGAVYGLLVIFAFLAPRAKLMLLFIPFPISAVFLVPLLLAGDLIFGLTEHSIGNIAHFAHIGGAITGCILMLIILAFRKIRV